MSAILGARAASAARVPIVPINGLLARMRKLTPEALAEVRELLLKIQSHGPYCSELADRYETENDESVFICYSSNGFSLEWYVEASEFLDDEIAIPGVRVFLTDLRITGNRSF